MGTLAANNNKIFNFKRNEIILGLASCFIIFGLSLFLFYNQISTSGYGSDLPVHLALSLQEGGGYSLIMQAFGFLFSIIGNHYAALVLLALVQVFLFVATYIFIINLSDIAKTKAILLSFAMFFIMTLWVPGIQGSQYFSNFTPNSYHNSTIIALKPFSVLAILYFLNIDKQKNINYKNAAIFFGCLTIANAVKPNFYLMFAPAVLIYLIYDFIMQKGKNIAYCLKVGVLVLLSAFPIIWQYLALFSNLGKYSNDSYIWLGIRRISPFAESNILALFCSLLLPALILVLFLDKFKASRSYKFIWLLAISSLAVASVIHEGGRRAHHGNFLWQIQIGIYVLYAYSLMLVFNMTKDHQAAKSEKLTKLLKYSIYIVFAIQMCLGTYYFTNILLGTGNL